MAVTDHYDFWYLDPDEEISDFPSMWDFNIDKIDTAIHDAATAPVSLSRLPNLPASKTTTGTFADARIPSSIARSSTVAGDISDGDAATLSAAKAYTDDAATAPVSLSRLPNLPASKTTTGTFADARIPNSIARTADVDGETTALKQRIEELEDLTRSTGPRDVSNLLNLENGFTGGDLFVQRDGSTISFSASNIMTDESETGWVSLCDLGSSFEPTADLYGNDFRGNRWRIKSSGTVQIQNPKAYWNYISMTYLCNRSFPPSNPGDPA